MEAMESRFEIPSIYELWDQIEYSLLIALFHWVYFSYFSLPLRVFRTASDVFLIKCTSLYICFLSLSLFHASHATLKNFLSLSVATVWPFLHSRSLFFTAMWHHLISHSPSFPTCDNFCWSDHFSSQPRHRLCSSDRFLSRFVLLSALPIAVRQRHVTFFVSPLAFVTAALLYLA